MATYLAINGLVRYLAIQYDEVNLVYSNTHDNVIRQIYSGEPNIKFIKYDKMDVEEYKDENTINLLNQLGYEDIYKSFNVSLDIRWDLSYIDINKQQCFFKDVDKYIFVCDDINSDKIPNLDTDIFIFHPFRNYYRYLPNHKYYNKWTEIMSNNIFDYITMIQNAEELHTTYNSLFNLSLYLDLSNIKELILYDNKNIISFSKNQDWKIKSIDCDNYIVGGKFGDMIHLLYVIMATYTTNKKRGNLYITDNTGYGGDRFTINATSVHTELQNIILQQDYINKFEILSKQPEKFINLNIWRHAPLMGRTDWIMMLSNTYNIPIISTSWINIIDAKNNQFADKILIHRSQVRHNNNFPWNNIVTKNKCIFITCNKIEYDIFPCKDNVELYLCSDLNEMIIGINNCKFFIGNQSSPLAIAWALFKPMMCELYPVDAISYKGISKYNENAFWINGNESHLANIEKHINL